MSELSQPLDQSHSLRAFGDSKTQAAIRYGWHRARIREERFFPEKFASKKDVTLRAWLARCLEGCTNRGIQNERRYNRRWSLGRLGKRLLTEITSEDLRGMQVQMRAKFKPRPAHAPKIFS